MNDKKKSDGGDLAELSVHIRSVLPHLNGTLRVLLVDDSKNMAELVSLFLERYKFFAVTQCTSRPDAEKAGEKSVWHCCVLDLFVPLLSDGLSLLDRLGKRYPVITLSGQASGSAGFAAARLNAVDYVEKGSMNSYLLVEKIFLNSLKRKLFPFFPKACESPLMNAAMARVFQENPPEGVAEWANMLDVTDRSLEQICSQYTGKSPRDLLALHTVYNLAFKVFGSSQLEDLKTTAREASLISHYAAYTSKLIRLIREKDED